MRFEKNKNEIFTQKMSAELLTKINSKDFIVTDLCNDLKSLHVSLWSYLENIFKIKNN
jgi:hypothetical protein